MINLYQPERNDNVFWRFIKNHPRGLSLLAGVMLTALFFSSRSDQQVVIENSPLPPEPVNEIQKAFSPIELVNEKPPFTYKPVPLSMDQMKKRGCVTDGLLSGYGKDTGEAAAMINRSKCIYLHRALETWGETPDFEKAREVMERITRTDVVYGMFLAESLKENAEMYYPEEKRKFDFGDMCQKGTDNRWGPHTCIPDLSEKEYRKYLVYIMKQAIDLGIQNFMFGQIYYQESDDLKKTEVKDVLDDVRAYAKEKNVPIVIGAQTGTITNEKYLNQFDYIEGGVGIGDDGKIENGPCWSQKESCWALLWHDQWRTRANNVFVHLDWSGLKFDDMSCFARMDAEKRAAVLKELYTYFTKKNIGFLMPMMATLNKENGGCRGPKKGLYSASNEYSCDDETVINSILSGS